MARRNKSSVVRNVFLLLIALALVFFVWWGSSRILDATQPQVDRIDDVESEVEDLRAEVSALRSEQRYAFGAKVLIWLIVTAGVSIPLSLWVRNRGRNNLRMMSIDESEEKSRELVVEREGREPVWVETGVSERREGRGKLYVHTFGFSPKTELGVTNWDDTKIVVIENMDWKHGRTDNIPRGMSPDQAIEFVLHKRDVYGMTMQRDERFTDAESYFEHLGRIRKQRTTERDILEEITG